MRQAVSIVLVDPDDSYEVVADSRDIRRWESAHDQPFASPVSFTKLAELGYFASVRTGRFAGSWDEFDGRCADAEGAELADGEDAGRPTQPGRTADTSVSSPPGSVSSHPPSRPKARPSSSPSPTSSSATPQDQRRTA